MGVDRFTDICLSFNLSIYTAVTPAHLKAAYIKSVHILGQRLRLLEYIKFQVMGLRQGKVLIVQTMP